MSVTVLEIAFVFKLVEVFVEIGRGRVVNTLHAGVDVHEVRLQHLEESITHVLHEFLVVRRGLLEGHVVLAYSLVFK